LVERIERGEPQSSREIILKPELIVRKTCGFHLRGYQVESKIDMEQMGSASIE
jgi:hypothetical protein